MRSLSFFLLLAVLLGFSAQAKACSADDCVSYPADAGALNVRDFGAKGDGVHDDTSAINTALLASGEDTGRSFWKDRIVYLPEGTYRITAPIVKRYQDGRFASGMLLMGQSRGSTILRLDPATPGYTDPQKPQAVIQTTSKLLGTNPTEGGRDYLGQGEGNDAYANSVENLTIEVGAGNPGAIGIDYLANNTGVIRHVTLRAAAQSGLIGISATRRWPGPALLQDVLIDGFDTGFKTAWTEYGLTLERIILKNQRSVGILNQQNMLTIHDLTISEVPTPVLNDDPKGLIVIRKAAFTTSAANAGAAIRNSGTLNISGLKSTGYAGQAYADGVYEGTTLKAALAPTLVQPQDPPLGLREPVTKWVSVAAFGAKPDTGADVTAALRQAFASGAKTLYFPHGTYLISDNITVPPTVERIVGMTSTITAYPQRSSTFSREKGMLRLTNTKPLVIERMALDHSDLGFQVAFEAMGAGPVVLRDVVGAGTEALRRQAEGGPVFIENLCCGTVSLKGTKGVWARQLNTEGGGVRVASDQAPLWVLGFKTEGYCTVYEAKNGAKAEWLGGLVYVVRPVGDKPLMPVFITHQSKLNASYVEEAFNADSTYPVHLFATTLTDEKVIKREDLPPRGVGRMIGQITSP